MLPVLGIGLVVFAFWMMLEAAEADSGFWAWFWINAILLIAALCLLPTILPFLTSWPATL